MEYIKERQLDCLIGLMGYVIVNSSAMVQGEAASSVVCS
ncbi:hypothetical protein AHF37_03438 [Paragonimus kellicotti]|nr:hypothetical protein AHF37_03438 [Paragonimus kellicotti]